ncbi:hypothetical protein [Promicromonospora sp. NPDC019610]|uniref:hypothetical protein n=1 Tax=Promicromonospora sp. NPDC019610 TaxID=3364405 RepID=UPI00378CD23E
MAVVIAGTLAVIGGHYIYTTMQDRWAWRLADLDANEIYLSGDSSDIEDGTVVEESMDYVVVKYSREIDWIGTPTGEFDTVCYRFAFENPGEFTKVSCP